MKQILKLIFLLVIGQTAFAQAPSNYTNINGRYRWIAGMFDSTFHIPKGTTPSLRTGGSTNGGALFYKTADSSLQLYTGTQWLRMLKVGDTTGMLTPYFNSVGVGLKNTGQTVYADTLLLSTRAWRQKGIDSVVALIPSLSGYVPYTGATQDLDMGTFSVNAKSFHIKGTAGQGHLGLKHQTATPSISANESGVYADVNGDLGLKNDNLYTSIFKTSLNTADRTYTFQNKSYTVGDSADIAARVKYTDTASMLSPYLRSNVAAATYVPLTRTITINGTSQDLSANRTYNVGTVTSVATNTGTGITGGTITTSGTIAADTLLLSTRAWRQKGVDSVASLINTRISGTTNYIPKFTSSSAIGNSQIFDNGTSVGINTITPSASYKLDVNGYARASSFYVPSGASGGGFIFDAGGNAGIGIAQSGNILQYYTGGSERMRLDASGNLGINTSSPSYKLDVNGSINGTSIYVTNTDGYLGNINSTGANGGYFAFSTSGAVIADIGTSQQIFGSGGNDMFGINARGSRNLAFGTNNTERMRITSGGNVLVGTTTFYTGNLSGSASGLNINASIPISLLRESGTGNTFYNGIASSTIYSGTQNSIPYAFVTNDIERMRITSGGQVGIGTSNPNVYGNGFTNQFTVSTTSGYANITVAGSSGNSGGIDFGNQTVRHAGVYGLDGSDLGFYTNGSNSGSGLTERMRITSGGELLINTTSDAGDYKLQVNGNTYFNGSATINATTGNNDLVFLATTRPSIFVNSTNIGLQIRTNGTGVLELNGDNSSTGDVNINNALIYVDASASSVGIGTNAPSAKLEVNGAIKTAAPSGGTAAAWKLGERVASAGVTFNDQQYIQLDIGGTLYYLATVDLPMPEAYPQATSGPSNNYKITPVQVKTTKDAEIEKLRKEIEELKQLIKNK